ncbi:MAG: hypothetical protein ABSF70_20495 [Terracidiphilus sp.]
MPTGVLKACIFMGCFLLASITGSAQEVVHALTGSVVSVDAVAKTITVFTDSHSNEIFRDMRNSNTSIDFDKSVRIDSTPADDLVLGHFAFPQIGKADIWHGSCLKSFHNLDYRPAGGVA